LLRRNEYKETDSINSAHCTIVSEVSSFVGNPVVSDSEYTKGGGIGFAHTIQKYVFVALIAALIGLSKYLIFI